MYNISFLLSDDLAFVGGEADVLLAHLLGKVEIHLLSWDLENHVSLSVSPKTIDLFMPSNSCRYDTFPQFLAFKKPSLSDPEHCLPACRISTRDLT